MDSNTQDEKAVREFTERGFWKMPWLSCPHDKIATVAALPRDETGLKISTCPHVSKDLASVFR
jgi:hypothetical protein